MIRAQDLLDVSELSPDDLREISSITVNCPVSVREAVKQLAFDETRSVNSFMNRLLVEIIEQAVSDGVLDKKFKKAINL